MDWHKIVPQERHFSQEETAAAYEVRLRCGRPMEVTGPGGILTGTHILTSENLQMAAQALTGCSLAQYESVLREGFVPLPGGHRMGVCGRMEENGLYVFSSVCVRIAHEIKGAAQGIFSSVQGKSVIILGPPGSGKTTLLRDLIRLTARHHQVAVADTRGEIAGCFGGTPQLDVGPRCDVMTGGRKDEIMMVLLRAMCPQVIAADEIGHPKETEAFLEMRKCGVSVLATAHAASLSEAKCRPGLAPLFEHRVFDACVVLSAPGRPPCCIRLCEE